MKAGLMETFIHKLFSRVYLGLILLFHVNIKSRAFIKITNALDSLIRKIQICALFKVDFSLMPLMTTTVLL